MQVEDRPIVKEIKTYVREHHPVEKEFVVETRPTGQCLFSPKLEIKACTIVYLLYFEKHTFAKCCHCNCASM